jgi:hypothetical protein
MVSQDRRHLFVTPWWSLKKFWRSNFVYKVYGGGHRTYDKFSCPFGGLLEVLTCSTKFPELSKSSLNSIKLFQIRPSYLTDGVFLESCSVLKRWSISDEIRLLWLFFWIVPVTGQMEHFCRVPLIRQLCTVLYLWEAPCIRPMEHFCEVSSIRLLGLFSAAAVTRTIQYF